MTIMMMMIMMDQDYVVELEGLDPWDKGAVKLGDNTPVFESFFVQGLKPFSTYLLRVFTRNKAGFQSRVSLDIKARTLETVPEPPTNIHLKAISPSSVHMQWSPAWPPTGQVLFFKISFRQQDKYWSQPTQVDLTHRYYIRYHSTVSGIIIQCISCIICSLTGALV